MKNRSENMNEKNKYQYLLKSLCLLKKVFS